MRRILFVWASVVLCAAPASAQQNDAASTAAKPSPAAQDPAHATHKALGPIGQALSGLLREAARSQSSQRIANDDAAGTPKITAPVDEAGTRATDDPAPVAVAVH